METNRLHQFKILFETGNLRQAAGLMHISHSGLSKSIHTLESEMNIKLFRPYGRGLEATPEAKAFYREAQRVLEAVAALKGIAAAPQTPANKKVKIGTFEVFSTYLSSRLASASPDAEHEFSEYIPGPLEAALLNREIEYGITYNPIPHRELDFIKVAGISMGIFARASSHLLKLPFAELPFVVPLASVQGSPTKVKGLDGWPDDRIPRSIKFKVTLMETALELIRSGLAVGYLPKFVAKLHNERVKPMYQLKPIPTPSPLNKLQPVYLLKRKSDPETKAFRQIAKVLRALE